MPFFFSFAFYHSDKVFCFLNTLLFDRPVRNETQSIWVFALCVIDSCVCLAGVWLVQTCQEKYTHTHTHTFHCLYSTLGLIIYLILSYTLFIVWTEFRPVSITHTDCPSPDTHSRLSHCDILTYKHTLHWELIHLHFFCTYLFVHLRIFVIHVNRRIRMVLQTICSCVSWISIN